MEQTELQQSIFSAPPAGTKTTSDAETQPKANPAVDQVMRDGTPESRGQKRTRDDEDKDESESESESEEDVAMEEDSEED